MIGIDIATAPQRYQMNSKPRAAFAHFVSVIQCGHELRHAAGPQYSASKPTVSLPPPEFWMASFSVLRTN